MEINRRTQIFLMLAMGAGIFATIGPALAAEVNSTDFSTRRIERMKQQLSLSDDQVAKIQDILKNEAPVQNPMRPMTKEERQKFFETRKIERSKIQSDINSVLTGDQQKKLTELQQNRQENNNHRQWAGRGNWQNSQRWHGRGRDHHREWTRPETQPQSNNL